MAVVAGSQGANATAIQTVPAGLPDGVRIRTSADVFPYAVAALGTQGARALMALVDSKSYLAATIAGYGTADTSNPYGVYPQSFSWPEVWLLIVPKSVFDFMSVWLGVGGGRSARGARVRTGSDRAGVASFLVA